jgi:hypothetical protein
MAGALEMMLCHNYPTYCGASCTYSHSGNVGLEFVSTALFPLLSHERIQGTTLYMLANELYYACSRAREGLTGQHSAPSILLVTWDGRSEFDLTE